MSASGNRVTLEKDGGEIVHVSSGRKIQVHRKGGVYVVKMWVPATAAKGKQDAREASGFPRPGAV